MPRSHAALRPWLRPKPLSPKPWAPAGGINPDVALESYTMNITTLDGFSAFKESVTGPDGRSRVDLVLSCVDNYEARMTINQVRGPRPPGPQGPCANSSSRAGSCAMAGASGLSR